MYIASIRLFVTCIIVSVVLMIVTTNIFSNELLVITTAKIAMNSGVFSNETAALSVLYLEETQLEREDLDVTGGHTDICNQSHRRNLISNMCEMYTEMNKQVRRSTARLLVNHNYRVAYCVIEKAACSTWKTILANISSGGNVKAGMSLGQIRRLHASIRNYDLYTLPYNDSLSNYTKFLVVRHPLDRLVSAYRDKMKGGDVTFKAGAMKVIEQFRTNMTNNDTYPTFKEFIQMVISKKMISRNPHWDKYFYRCDPCFVHYDYILKVETMEHDMKMFLFEVFQDQLKFVTDNKLNSFRPADELSDKGYSHQLKLYEELSGDEIEAVISKFQHEIDFFGYSFNQKTLSADCCDKQPSSTDTVPKQKCCC